MLIVHYIRHAKACSRDEWDGDDRLRPLNDKGERQAERLAETFDDAAPDQIISSPAARCVTTVEPLARRFGLDVTVDELCDEGRRLTIPPTPGLVVVCAHGDNIPDLLGRLRLDWYKCAKASTWRLEIDDTGSVTDAQYLEPPDV